MTNDRLEVIDGDGEPEGEPAPAVPAKPTGPTFCGRCGVRTITAGGVEYHYEDGRTRLGC